MKRPDPGCHGHRRRHVGEAGWGGGPPSHRLGAILLTSAIASGILGCEAPPESGVVTVSDSAGTRIVTYTSLEDEAFPVIALEPRVDTIGAAEGAEEYFFRRIVTAELVPRGIVTADLQDRELRYFDGTGRFVSSVGGDGVGPGEFQSLTWMQGYGDSLFLAWDQLANRLTKVRLTEAGLSHDSNVQGPWTQAESPIGVFSPGRIAVDNARMIPVGGLGSLSEPFQVVVSVVNLDVDPSAASAAPGHGDRRRGASLRQPGRDVHASPLLDGPWLLLRK